MFRRRLCAEFDINHNNPVLWAQPLMQAAAEVLLRYYLKLLFFERGSVIKAWSIWNTTQIEILSWCRSVFVTEHNHTVPENSWKMFFSRCRNTLFSGSSFPSANKNIKKAKCTFLPTILTFFHLTLVISHLTISFFTHNHESVYFSIRIVSLYLAVVL